jgi:hypothetical protein
MPSPEVEKKGAEMLPDSELKNLFDKILKETERGGFENFEKQWAKGILMTKDNPALSVKTEEEKMAWLKSAYEKSREKVLKQKEEFDKKHEQKSLEATPEEFLRQALVDIEYLHSSDIDLGENPELKGYQEKLAKQEKLTDKTKQELEIEGFKASETLVFDDNNKFQRIESTPFAKQDFNRQIEKILGRKPTTEEIKEAEKIKEEYIRSMYIDRDGKPIATPLSKADVEADRAGDIPVKLEKKVKEMLKEKEHWGIFPETREELSKTHLLDLPKEGEKWLKFLVTGDHPVYEEINAHLTAVVPENFNKLKEALNEGKTVKVTSSIDNKPVLLQKIEGKDQIKVTVGVGFFKTEEKIDFNDNALKKYLQDLKTETLSD